jgi:hypothetical protein
VRLLLKQRSPGRLGLPSVAKRPFRLTTERDPQGKNFPSFAAARSYADCELPFGEAFVITHLPRGGAWHGRAGFEGEIFELPVEDIKTSTYH